MLLYLFISIKILIFFVFLYFLVNFLKIILLD